MKRVLFSTVLLALLWCALATPGSAQVQNLDDDSYQTPTIIFVVPVLPPPQPGTMFPEYCAYHPQADTIAYSSPDFKEHTCFWVQTWNAPGWFAENRDDSWYPIRKDSWDGCAYDGMMLIDPVIKEDRVYFNMLMMDSCEVERYFLKSQLSEDPRTTNWWMAFALDSFPSLWQAVERAALSEDHPEVTQAIIDNMRKSGVIGEKADSMTTEEIRTALIAYTDIALFKHMDSVRSVVGEDHLTEQKFSRLRFNDTLFFYYNDRFGPVLEPNIKLVVLDNRNGILDVASVGSTDLMSCSWADIKAYADFIAVSYNQTTY